MKTARTKSLQVGRLKHNVFLTRNVLCSQQVRSVRWGGGTERQIAMHKASFFYFFSRTLFS